MEYTDGLIGLGLFLYGYAVYKWTLWQHTVTCKNCYYKSEIERQESRHKTDYVEPIWMKHHW